MSPGRIRRANYTAAEAQVLFAERAKHPTMSTNQWCRQRPIDPRQYRELMRRFGAALGVTAIKAPKSALAAAARARWAARKRRPRLDDIAAGIARCQALLDEIKRMLETRP